MDDAKFKELDDKLFDLINPFLANGDQNFSNNSVVSFPPDPHEKLPW